MSDIKDDFSDIIAKNRGMFAGEHATLDDALGTLDNVQDAVRPDGVAFELTCHGCKRPSQYVVEYPEMIALKFRIDPSIAFTRRSNALAHPQQACPNPSTWAPVPQKGELLCQDKCPCGWKLRIALTFNEPEKYLRQARQRGYLGPQMEGPIQAHCQQLHQMGVARRR